MKIAITGKGGVGKTTIAGTLARIYAKKGKRVIAIDADPDANLASALGVPENQLSTITPVAAMPELIAERTGAELGSMGQVFRLNPEVDDIPERFSVTWEGVKLLVLGEIESGGSGCICPASTLLRALLRHLVLQRDELVIMDMEAGIEHLGRGTTESMDAMLIIVEPGQRSAQTAKTIKRLAEDLGVKKVFAVVNRLNDVAILDEIKEHLGGIPVLGYLPERQMVRKADLDGNSPYDTDPEFAEKVAALAADLEKELAS